MAHQEGGMPHTGRMPKVRVEGESPSTVITIPKGVADELGLEPDEKPEDITFDREGRELSFQFTDD